MADQILACPNCGQQTIFADVDEPPRGVICGDCGPGNVLDAPPANEAGKASAEEASARETALGEFSEP